MIPTPFFLGFNTIELVFFELTQTALNLVLGVILLQAILQRYDSRRLSKKRILLTAVSVELCNIFSSFFWYYLVLYAIAGFPLLVILMLTLPFFAIYFNYVNNQEGVVLSMKNTLIVHLVSVIPAIILSSILSSLLFNLIGIRNFFIFS
ncbi:MAG: hypothetical protein ACOC44_16665 [Promethearchaeia archaeon]